jgi:hypothetical protein
MAADTSTNDDWLEQALRADAVDHSTYITDDGFTARVLERLPQPVALPAWRRPVVALLWLVLAAAVVAALPGLFDDVFRSIVAAVVAQPVRLPQIAGALALLGALAWSSIVYAMRED